jgi:hypothetical protein
MIGMRIRNGFAALSVLWSVLATSAGGDTWVQDRWRRTTYYRAIFVAEIEGAGQLQIAAVDSYAVYLNGALVGSDSTWTRMRSYPVEVVSGENHLAMRVVNRGRGVGSGLIVRLAVDSLQVETTVDRSALIWRWTEVEQQGNGWLTGAVEEWGPVQSGSVDTSRIEGLVPPAPEVVAGFAGNVDVGGAEGGVRLKWIQGENLALDKPANRVETVDGDLLTAWEPPVASLNFTASVDLRERFLVHKVRVLTKGPGFADNSLRGYSVQVSDDQIRWSEVGSLHDITDYVQTEVRFAPTWTRHVRIVIVDINAVTQPKVAEIEVYGDGFSERGGFVSEPLALDDGGARTNFGRVDWEVTVPERTELSVQFRTGNAAEDFIDPEGGWSGKLSNGGIWFPAAEPGRLVQYRINMETRDERRSPVFHRLQMEYSPDDVPVSGASAWVTPNEAPMGVDTTFTYAIDFSFGPGDLGVERLQIAVPGEAVLDPAEVGVPIDSWHSTQDRLTLIFAEPLRDVDLLRIPLRTRTFANIHPFRAFVFSPGSDNPLNVEQDRGVNPLSGRSRSWELLATTARERSLSQVRARPSVFTPNGDGINDDTVVEFVLAKVDVPRRVRIRITDLTGRTVAELNGSDLTSGSYLRSSHSVEGEESPGFWDGRDGAGERVPPGIYLYRVEVELDSGDEVEMGTVGVAY